MTAQEWLEELERLRKAATPGPWSKSEQGTNGTYHHRIDGTMVAKKFLSTLPMSSCQMLLATLHDAAYIVAACNAVRCCWRCSELP